MENSREQSGLIEHFPQNHDPDWSWYAWLIYEVVKQLVNSALFPIQDTHVKGPFRLGNANIF